MIHRLRKILWQRKIMRLKKYKNMRKIMDSHNFSPYKKLIDFTLIKFDPKKNKQNYYFDFEFELSN